MDVSVAADETRRAVAVESIRRYWFTVVLTVVVCGVLAAAYEVLSARTYVAQARVVVQPLVGNAFSPDTSTNAQNAVVALQTEAQLVKSAAVGSRVTAISATHDCLVGHAQGTLLTNAQIVQVSYTSDDADTAQRCAEQFARQYLAYRHSLAVATRASALTRLDKESQDVSALLISAKADAKGPNPPPSATQDVALYTVRLGSLQDATAAVSGESVQAGNVNVHAIRPAASGLSPVLVVVAVAILGVLLGLVLAVWRGLRSRFGGRRGPVDAGGVPTLAVTFGPRKGAPGTPLPAAADDDGFRLASVALLAATAPERRVIAVTSLTAIESLAAVSFRLARALAEAGYSVVAIDSETHEPTLSDIAGVDDKIGLAEILAGRDFDRDQLSEADGVSILSAGHLDEARINRGRSVPRMRDLIAELRRDTDFIVINAASLDSSAGLGQMLSVDAAVLVADAQSTEASDIIAVRRTIERMDIVLLGTIVNRRRRDSSAAPSKRSEAKSADKPADASKKAAAKKAAAK